MVYSDKREWDVPREVCEAIAAGDAEAAPDIPRMQHEVIDLRRCADSVGDGILAVLLVRLQHCDDPDALSRAAEPLREWLEVKGCRSLMKAFAAWISDVRIPDLGWRMR